MVNELKTISEALPTLSAVILAGGHSRRMGRDKALLTLPNGQTLLYQTAQVAQQLASNVVVVTPWPDRYQSTLPPKVQLVKELIQPDPSASSSADSSADSSAGSTAGPFSAGPLSGFAQGLRNISSEWCLLLACDLPYLQSAPLQDWWAWLTPQLQRQTIVASLVPSTAANDRKRWEPLCGFYHRSCLSALSQYLGDPPTAVKLQSKKPSRSYSGISFQAWLKTLPIAAYTDLPPQLLFNCNTPADWDSTQHFSE